MSLQERKVYNSVPYEKKRMQTLPHYTGPHSTEQLRWKRGAELLRPSIRAQVRSKSRQGSHGSLFKNNVVSDAIEYSTVGKQQKELWRQGREELEAVRTAH